MNVFERSYEENPPLIIMTKSGTSHVFVGAPLPKGGLTKALCGARPPMFGGEALNMISILPNSITSRLFGSVEGEAPGHWEKLQRALRDVNCGTCRGELKRYIDLAWEKHGLMGYARGDWIDLDHARALVAAIPEGRWTGSGDIAEACGGTRDSGAALRHFLSADKHDSPSHVCRVLFDDGSTLKDCRRKLESEGIVFSGEGSGAADPAKWISASDLRAISAAP